MRILSKEIEDQAKQKGFWARGVIFREMFFAVVYPMAKSKVPMTSLSHYVWFSRLPNNWNFRLLWFMFGPTGRKRHGS